MPTLKAVLATLGEEEAAVGVLTAGAVGALAGGGSPGAEGAFMPTLPKEGCLIPKAARAAREPCFILSDKRDTWHRLRHGKA